QTQAIGWRASRTVDTGEYTLVVGRIDDDGYPARFGAMVLGGSAQHGRAANINIFNGIGKSAAFACDGFAERVEIDDQQIDAIDAVLFDGLQVFFAVAASQQATVDFWVQGFDTTIQDFRGARMLGNF